MSDLPPISPIPPCAWSRPLGLGWDHAYTVRYASNLDDGPWHGMPLGGLGAGCMGRSPRGDFNLWHIDGGEHIFQTLPACQFSVFEQVGDQTQAYALSTAAPTDGSLATWQWYPASDPGATTGTYHALYPRSWFVYEGVLQAQLTCEQFSPIWPDNYRESSYPVAVFLWTLANPTDAPVTLSLMLTWHNTVGWFTNANPSPEVVIRDDGSPVYDYQSCWGESAGNYNQLLEWAAGLGLVMGRDRELPRPPDPQIPQEGDGQWAVATTLLPNAEGFYHTRWNPLGDGAEIWQTFAQDGSLTNHHDATPAMGDEQIAGAIAVRLTLPPRETRQIPFMVSWDFPVTEFAQGVNYYRRYTDFFGRDGHQAAAIAQTALQQYPAWHTQIQAWQQSILTQAHLPDWLKMALFNELYDLTSGGTLWSAADERDPIGQFAVLECLDYRWYESLDVRLYGGFALAMLWPKLEKAVLRAFARAIPQADSRLRPIGYYLTIGAPSPKAARKVANATPHDLGAPNEHPWEQTNYTCYQDCNLWKDLACDFVLQVYRAYQFTGSTDRQFLADCWPAIVAALTYLKQFDQDHDGIPENAGAPDQTFDDWRLQGISAYCGGLWLAALEAAIVIGQLLQPPQTNLDITGPIVQFRAWLSQAKPRYHATLWNGHYYQLDSGSGSDVVMADQLCGQYFARLLGLPDIVPADCARSALRAVYGTCFVKFNQYLQRQDEPIGAANGVRPDGSPENPNATHPLEVWTGINFGLAAFLAQMEMKSEAFAIAQAVVHQIYTGGLQFRTPEAITADRTFRACHYLRPMAIWALYHELV
ncbi:GH116 family glycosyl hydrolase [Trichothermofontia sp.]